MRVSFGPIFARRALAPLGRAKVELGAGRVKEALEALDPRALSSALRHAITDVAASAGATKAEVEALIDWAPIDLALASLRESRATAAAAWGELPPIAGGLLAGVAEVTTHAENDDVGFYLDRLGQKMARDRSLAGPIDTLAADVEGWQGLLTSTARAIDAHPRLLAARKRRVLLRALALLGVLAVIVPIATVLALRHRARAAAEARVATALAAADPCAAEAIDAGDLEIAGPASQTRAADLVRVCANERARLDHLAKCEALVGAVEARRTLEGEPAVLAGPQRALFGRMIVRNLEAFDLLEAPTFPCSEVDGPKRLWKVFLEAAGASTMIWRDPPVIDHAIVTRLAEAGLAQASRGTLLARAEEISGHGVRQGDEPSLKRGGELCALCKRLRIETAGNCRGVESVLARSVPATPPP
jgi:hypothetical protein